MKRDFLGDKWQNRGEEEGGLGIWSALSYVTPSEVLSAQHALWPEQKSCDFEYLSFFVCVWLSVSRSAFHCSAPVWCGTLEGRAINRERTTWRETEKISHSLHKTLSSEWSFHFDSCAQACWLSYSSLAHQHPLTHISVLSHFYLSWLAEKLCSFLIQFIALVNISLR